MMMMMMMTRAIIKVQ